MISFSEMGGGEGFGEKLGERGRLHLALQIRGMDDEIVRGELGDDLATESARRPSRMRVRHDHDFRDGHLTVLADGFEHSGSFGANGTAVGRVLDIAAGVDFPVREPDRGADFVLAVRAIRLFSRAYGELVELLNGLRCG